MEKITPEGGRAESGGPDGGVRGGGHVTRAGGGTREAGPPPPGRSGGRGEAPGTGERADGQCANRRKGRPRVPPQSTEAAFAWERPPAPPPRSRRPRKGPRHGESVSFLARGETQITHAHLLKQPYVTAGHLK